MASFNGPKLTNPIRTDVPDTQNVLVALAKQDPTSISDIPVGAKRLYEASSGKWQWQEYNGSSWAPVPFLQHNVDQLDGYHAAITPAANTIAVRNASGLLEDSIAGNAATASSAATLSQTLPVNKGGTGATTSEAARSNLGVPPTSHASTATTYGVANASQYGHVKLSDAANSSSGVTGGVAATPAAVKAAKDAADAAQSSADTAMTKASTLATSSTPGIVKPGTGMTVATNGALNVDKASTSKAGIVQLNDTVTSTSSTQAATANAVKTAYDKAVEATSKAGLPLGYIYAWPYSTPMDGSIQINGQMLNRQLYADLFAYAQAHDQVITEAEWQAKAAQQGGYCAYYSDGDGSTTFRAPKFAPYQKLTMVAANAGKYYEAGLPNIEGDIDGGYDGQSQFLGLFHAGTGCFRTSGKYNQRFPGVNAGGANYTGMSLDASGSDKTYGNSDTVRPESMDWIVCVVAFGTATNVGSVDVANVMSAVGQVQSEVGALQADKLGIDTVHIIKTWSSGKSWYRKYSDGWVEQGGFSSKISGADRISLPIEMKNADYSVVLGKRGSDTQSVTPQVQSQKTTNFVLSGAYGGSSQEVRPSWWRVSGYHK